MQFADNNKIENGLILLVDMGSLSELSVRLKNKISGPLLILDYVSTPLVIEVGSLLLQDKSINEISDEILNNVKINKQLIYPIEKKKKAIITCCYTGLGSAIQIQDIISKSINQINNYFTIIPYDYAKLQQNKQKEVPFQIYDVLAIIGTSDPKIEGVKYIGLDQLMNGKDIEILIDILKSNFEIDEERLKKELVFNFSIKKIIEDLTILDPNKVLKFLEIAVEKLEEKLNIILCNDRRFLLYLHCSCMIERILRKELLDQQEDIEEFLKKEKSNIEVVRYSFVEIESEYNISISDLEMRLICDIIFGE